MPVLASSRVNPLLQETHMPRGIRCTREEASSVNTSIASMRNIRRPLRYPASFPPRHEIALAALNCAWSVRR